MADIYGEETDYDVEQKKLARQQKLMEAMTQQAVEGQMNKQPGVKTSPLEALLRLYSVYGGAKNQEKLVEQQGQLAQQQQQQALQYGQDLQGAVEPEARSSKLMQGMMSRNAQIRALADEERKTQVGQQKELYKARLGAASPTDLMAGGDPSKMRPKQDVRVTGDQIFAGQPETGYNSVGDGRAKYTGVTQLGVGANGQPIMGSTEIGTNKPLFAPGAGTSVTVKNLGATAENAFSKALGEGRAKRVDESTKSAEASARSLPALQVANDALDSGIKSGILANASLGIAKLGEAFGMKADPQTAATETYRGAVANQVLEIIKTLRPATDQDVKFAKEASGADITLALPAMRNLLKIAEAAAYTSLTKHDLLIDKELQTPEGRASRVETYKIPFEVRPSADIEQGRDGTFTYRGLRPEPAKSGPPKGALVWDPKTGAFRRQE